MSSCPPGVLHQSRGSDFLLQKRQATLQEACTHCQNLICKKSGQWDEFFVVVFFFLDKAQSAFSVYYKRVIFKILIKTFLGKVDSSRLLEYIYRMSLVFNVSCVSYVELYEIKY